MNASKAGSSDSWDQIEDYRSTIKIDNGKGPRENPSWKGKLALEDVSTSSNGDSLDLGDGSISPNLMKICDRLIEAFAEHFVTQHNRQMIDTFIMEAEKITY